MGEWGRRPRGMRAGRRLLPTDWTELIGMRVSEDMGTTTNRYEVKADPTRALMIGAMLDAGAELARRHGCLHVFDEVDRQKGVWGEHLTRWLEAEYGACTEGRVWSSSEAGKGGTSEGWADRCVELRWRFASPCLSVWVDGRRTFAEVQLTNMGDGNLADYDGRWRVHEIHCWEGEGTPMEPLIRELLEAVRSRLDALYARIDEVGLPGMP